jgi:hypothetical protein
MLIFQFFAFFLCRCTAFLCSALRFCAAFSVFRPNSQATHKKDTHSIHIVGQVAQANLSSRSDKAYSSQYQIPSLLGLNPKDVLNPRANLCPRSVSFLFPLRQLTMTAAFALDMFSKAICCQIFQACRRMIGRIRPYIFARIIGKYALEHTAVMLGSIRNGISPNQLVFHVYRNVILVTEKGLPVFFGPPGVNIFLPALVFWPVLGDLALLYPGILVSAVTLLGYAYYACIYDLTLHGCKAVGSKVGVKGHEQFLDYPGLSQVFPKSPDRCCIRNLAADVQAEEATEGVPVKDLKLSRIIRQIIQRLQDEDLKQQNDIVSLWPNIGLPAFVSSPFKAWAENLPINRFVYLGKRIAVFVDFMKPLLEIEKSWLDHGWSPSGVLTRTH